MPAALRFVSTADSACLQAETLGPDDAGKAPPHRSGRLPFAWRLPWPLPALMGGALGLGVFRLALSLNAAPLLAALLAVLGGLLPVLTASGRWRRALVGLCTPMLLLAETGLHALPAWTWLLAALALVLAYPISAWRDAPFFPTRAGSLGALAGRVRLGPHATVLDAGCGLGHGLRALREVYPQVRLRGVERSLPLSLACRLRCPWAQVRRADMWRQSWRGIDLVYLFQRPESMPRAMEKARRELRPGAWLVSLEFEAEGWTPHERLETPGGRPLWVYRMPAGGSRRPRATRR